MTTLSRSNFGGWAQRASWAGTAISVATLVVWALAVGSTFYWGMRLTANRNAGAAPSQPAPQISTDPAAVARLLGTRAASPVMPANLGSRFSLQGVVGGGPGGGAALISVDGKPAKAVRVGSVVEDGLILQSASARTVTLADSRSSPTVLTLQMPPMR